ncbi:hypothetical protein PG996_001967 [Apiospora saccharicola]|uniref:Uncharacterized protein n=1 Tax=Apiospora saccharicola TaxID=335842 RepID=A0ABR1WI40_9PEZI
MDHCEQLTRRFVNLEGSAHIPPFPRVIGNVPPSLPKAKSVRKPSPTMANSVAATTAAKNPGGGGATGPLTRSFRGFFHLTGG